MFSVEVSGSWGRIGVNRSVMYPVLAAVIVAVTVRSRDFGSLSVMGRLVGGYGDFSFRLSTDGSKASAGMGSRNWNGFTSQALSNCSINFVARFGSL